MAGSAIYQLYTISEGRVLWHVSDLTPEGGAVCRHVSDVTPADRRSSSATLSTTAARDRQRPDSHLTRTNSSGAATRQYNSFKKHSGGATIEKGNLAPALRTQVLVQIPVGKSQAVPKHGTRSLPNSSLQEAVEPLPRHATSATIRKDPGTVRQTTQAEKVLLPKINNLVNGELTSVGQNAEHRYRMPAPAGVPTTRNVVLVTGDKPPKQTSLVTGLPEWLLEPRQEQRTIERDKNAQNRRTDHPKPWLQVIPKKPQETGSGNKQIGVTSRAGVFHAPELRQKPAAEDEPRKAENKTEERRFRTPEKPHDGKPSKDSKEKRANGKDLPRKKTNRQRTVDAQTTPVVGAPKRTSHRTFLDHRTDGGGSSADSDQSADNDDDDDDGMFSFVKRKPTSDAQTARRQEPKKAATEAEDERKKKYTIQDAVSIYKQDYVRTKKIVHSLRATAKRRQSPEASPVGQLKERMLTRREATIYQNITKAYNTDEVKRRRENQFYRRLLELQMKKWHREYRQHLKKQLEQLDRQQQQETQLIRVRRKFYEEQLQRFRTQYITRRMVTHESANRSEYGLPEDSFSTMNPPEEILYRRLKPKKFSFKKQYLRNKKKYDTIFKRRALFINEALKPPKMEGIDTVQLDGSGSRDVKDILKEAEDLLDETDQDSDDVSSLGDDISTEDFDHNVHRNTMTYKTTKPLPRKEHGLPEKKKKRVIVVPPPKKPAADRRRKQRPAKAKVEKSTNINAGAAGKDQENDQVKAKDKKPALPGTQRYRSLFDDWKMASSSEDEDDGTRALESEPASDLDGDEVGDLREESEAQKTGTQPATGKESRRMTRDPDDEVMHPKKSGEPTLSLQHEVEGQLRDVEDKQEAGSPIPGYTTALGGDDAVSADEKRQKDNSKKRRQVDKSADVKETTPSVYKDKVGSGDQVEPGDKVEANGGEDPNNKVDPNDKMSSKDEVTYKEGAKSEDVHDSDVAPRPSSSAVVTINGPSAGNGNVKGKTLDNTSESEKPQLTETKRDEKSPNEGMSADAEDGVNAKPERRKSEQGSDYEFEESNPNIKVQTIKTDPDKRLSPIKDTRPADTKPLANPSDDGKTLKGRVNGVRPPVQKASRTKQAVSTTDGNFSPESSGDNEQQSELEHTKRSLPKTTGDKHLQTAQTNDLPTTSTSAKQNQAGKTNRADITEAKTGKTDRPPPERGNVKGSKQDKMDNLPHKPPSVTPKITETKDRQAKPDSAGAKTQKDDGFPSKTRDTGQNRTKEKVQVSSKSRDLQQDKKDKTDYPKFHLADESRKPNDNSPKSRRPVKTELQQNSDLPTKSADGKHAKSGGKDEPPLKPAGRKLRQKENQRTEQDFAKKPTKPKDKKLSTEKGNDENKRVKRTTDKNTQKPHTKYSKTKPQRDDSSGRNNKLRTGSPKAAATRERQPAPSKRGKQDRSVNDRTTTRQKGLRSVEKAGDDDKFNISSYLDKKWPNIYDVRLSDDDSSDSDEDIFEKAMRKYGIRVDDSD